MHHLKGHINAILALLALILNRVHHFAFNALLELIQIWVILFALHVLMGIMLQLKEIQYVLVARLEHIHYLALRYATNAHQGLIPVLPHLIAINIII